MAAKSLGYAASILLAVFLLAAYTGYRHQGTDYSLKAFSTTAARRMLQGAAVLGQTYNVQWTTQKYDPMTIQVGDSVRFMWLSNHGVSQLPTGECPPSFTDSDVKSLAVPRGGGSLTVTLSTPGTFYFACPVGNGAHCKAGQLLQVNVVSVGAAAALTPGGGPPGVPGPTNAPGLRAPAPVMSLPNVDNMAAAASSAPAAAPETSATR